MTANATGRPKAAHGTNRKETIQTANALVTVERGPAGAVARIERTTDGYTREYAGPLPEATVDALKEVAGRV